MQNIRTLTQRTVLCIAVPALVWRIFTGPATAANAIQIENALSGTTSWVLSNPATNREIEGYASLTSVSPGGQISFFVNTADSSFSIEIFRTGWYNGAGGRQVLAPVTLPGTRQVSPPPDSVTGIIDCNWLNP